jgi:hypothetical protein
MRFVIINDSNRERATVLCRQPKQPYGAGAQTDALGTDGGAGVMLGGNGRGQWWNPSASHMHAAFPKYWLTNWCVS